MSLTVEIKKNLGDFCLDISFSTKGGVSGLTGVTGITGLLGASGGGKSMTLMCVAGIVKPDSGKIILNGRTLFDSERRVDLSPQRRRVGYLFQNYALFPNMSVRQNILCGMRNEKDKARRERVLRDMIGMMRLDGLENRRPHELSGGQQQRAALARILAGDPELLILDEPFSALDTHLRGQLQVELRKLLNDFGKDTVLVTHSRDEAYHLCRDIALVDSGKIIAHKDTKELFINPESRRAAYITGCKNVVDAKKSGEYEAYVPEWGARFTTSEPVRDDLCAIGVRAHYFNPKTVQNRFPVRFTGEIEGPFEYNVQFRCENQTDGSQDIWWLIPKEKRAAVFPAELGVSPANIMLLYR